MKYSCIARPIFSAVIELLHNANNDGPAPLILHPKAPALSADSFTS